MKRISSLSNLAKLKSFNERKDALFCQTPPQCSFHDEDGYARREFGRLAPKDQQKVMMDVYGIEELTEDESSDEEDSGVVESALHKLDAELQAFVGKKRSIEIARTEHPTFYEDRDFRIKFLETDNFNPKLAAKRMMKHLEKKLELFGSDKLSKKITLEDLNEDDMECLLSGGIQPIAGTDRGGRKVFFSRQRNWKYKEVANMLRACWYLGMAHLEGTDYNRGVVVVSYQTGPFSAELFNRSVFKSVMDLAKIMPVKLAGYHFCFDDIRYRMVWGLATVFVGKEARLRSRDHEGTHVECRYGLMSYGIPVDAMPIDIDGVEDNSWFLNWIEERRTKEATSPAASISREAN